MGKPCSIGEGVKKEVRANISRAIAGEKVEPVEKGRWAQSGERRAEKTGGIHARSGLVKKYGWPLPPHIEKVVKARFGKTVSPDQGTRIALSQHVPKLVRKAEAAQRISWEQSPTSKALTKSRRAERVARRRGGTTYRAVEQLEEIKYFLEHRDLDEGIEAIRKRPPKPMSKEKHQKLPPRRKAPTRKLRYRRGDQGDVDRGNLFPEDDEGGGGGPKYTVS